MSGNNEKMHEVTQCDKILKYLENHNMITALDAMRDLACMRLSARISDLEHRGYEFDHQPVVVEDRYGNKIRVMAYSLSMGV